MYTLVSKMCLLYLQNFYECKKSFWNHNILRIEIITQLCYIRDFKSVCLSIAGGEMTSYCYIYIFPSVACPQQLSQRRPRGAARHRGCGGDAARPAANLDCCH